MMISVMMPGGKEWFHDTQYASREVKEYIAQRLKSPETLPLPAERTSPHWLALAD